MLKMCAVTRMPALCASSMMAAYCAGVTFWTLPSRSSTQTLTICTPSAALSRTALRPSSSVSIWCVGRIGSLRVMPRPALRKRAAPGMTSLRIGSSSRLSVPMLMAALTPQ